MSHELDNALRMLTYVVALAVYFKYVMPEVVSLIDEFKLFVAKLYLRWYQRGTLNAEEKRLAENPGTYILAIKAHRARTGKGLRDAKDAIDAHMRLMGVQR